MLMNDAAQAVMAVGFFATVAVTVVSIGHVYVRTLEIRKKSRQADLSPEVQDRMSRIEQAVDAIAIEVERMSEGQRFTTRLLAERFGEGGTPPTVGRHSRADGTNGAGGNHVR
jgi:hypothetical protein